MAQFSRLDVLNTMIDTGQLPTFDAADVVVVGSGSAGAVAARQTPRQLSIRELQARLLSAGVFLAGARV